MVQLNTYALVRPYPGGLSITDAIQIAGNRRRPIRLERAGDAIDLMSVDVETFARSSYVGAIRRLFLSGVLQSIPQPVPEDRAALFQAAYGRLEESGGHLVGLAGAPKVIAIDAGMQVGVMGVPDETTMLPDVPTPAGMEQRSAQLEPGIMVPGNIEPTAEAAPEQPAPAKKVPGKRKGSKKDPGAAAPAEQAGKSFAEWKNNLDFQTQKARVAESDDAEFLRWVSENDESRQLQKIASVRLAEIAKA